MSVVGLVPAAGSGERLGTGGPKALVLCGGRPLVAWSVDALLAVCDRVVVALPPDPAEAGDSLGAEPWAGEVERVRGGASRSESVRAALFAAPEAEVAVVHDAARPLATSELVARCVAALAEGWDGAVAAAPVTDTVKEVRPADLGVVRTLERSVLWAIQTPQAFAAPVLRRALDAGDAALAAATDDAALVEAAGGRVRVVEAPPGNLKVTRPLDLRLAEELLRERAAGAAATAAPGPAPAAG